MPAPKSRFTIVEVTDCGRGRQSSRELSVVDDPMISLLLAVLAERRKQQSRAEAPPPYSGSDLEFGSADRLNWPWYR